MPGIYKIESRIKPNKIYIGSSINIKKRWTSHRYDFIKNKHRNTKLQNHYNKYGKNDLKMSILISCDRENLIINEQFFIDLYNPWFNILKIAGSTMGFIHSQETKERLSKNHKGLSHPQSLEIREKIKNAMIGNTHGLGHKMTEENRFKLSQLKKGNSYCIGRVDSEETCKKRNNSNKGQIRTPEMRERMRLSQLGKKKSEITKSKISKFMMGKKHTLGRGCSEETKLKMSLSHKKNIKCV